ncbi:hypothetical protein NBRC116596_22000 [Litorivita sp. NS0012-18]
MEDAVNAWSGQFFWAIGTRAAFLLLGVNFEATFAIFERIAWFQRTLLSNGYQKMHWLYVRAGELRWIKSARATQASPKSAGDA